MPTWYTNTSPAGWRPGPNSSSCKGFFYARAGGFNHPGGAQAAPKREAGAMDAPVAQFGGGWELYMVDGATPP